MAGGACIESIYIEVNPLTRRTGLGQLVVALIAHRALSLGSEGVAIPALESTVDFYTQLSRDEMSVETDKTPEELARESIDAALLEAGWVIQDREEMNLAAGLGVAIREFKTDAGFADYLLYVDKKAAGVIEAKKEGVVLTGIEAQTKDYAAKVPKHVPVPMRPLPFLYESTGVEPRFTDLLDPTPRSRRVFR